MHKRSTFTVFASLLIVGMLLGLAAPLSAMAKTTETQVELEQDLDKVETAVLDAISTSGSSDYVVEMAEKADLSAAYDMDWDARGEYVYETLRAVAARTQQPVIDILEKSGVSYQAFFAANEVAVTGGDQASLSAIAALPDVAHVRFPRTATIEPSFASLKEVTVSQTTNALDWGITDTGAPSFWASFGLQGDGIVVASIDTGVQWNHPALDQAFKCGTNPSDPACWADPSNICGGSACDNNGHGTHTMGTMVGDDDPSLTYQVGMAPNAQWIACKGCESSSCSDTALNACADWILAPDGDPANRPNIVNNSWGGGGGDTWYQAKVVAWRAAGIFPAFSSGNSGPTCGSIGSPSDYQESFSTANHTSSRVIASSSSRGPSTYGDDPYTKPNISAPGTSICSSVPTDGWNCSYSGTSMASPHTAGAVALLWSCNAALIGDMTATFEVLQATADTPPAGDCSAPPDGEGNFTYGYGYLNVLAAGQQVCAAGTIDGTVTNGSDPIEGATVTADNGAGLVVDTLTLADGTYALNLPADTYDVSATKYGFNEDVELGVVVVEGVTTTVDFVITPLASTLVSGNVSDGGVEGLGLHGYPLYASIRITATGFDQTIYTDPFTGYYEIELVEDTEHTFTVNAVPTGYETLVEAVTPTGTAYSHDITLMVEGAACAAPGYQPDYDIFYSFEGSDEGFTPGGTTSFAWGDFTSGPMEGHSGTKGIATNPGGDYNASELGWMASPVLDMTGYGTSSIAIQWYDWKYIESASFDWARLDVTKDGGATWATVWGPVGGVSDTEYHQQTVTLDPSYNVANFQMRFYFKSDSSVQYAGWYVDDIGIVGVPVPPPTTVFSTNFDIDNGGFTASGTNSTWAWGAPTSGPGAAYSPPNVWATNLAGYYNNSEESYITSPVVDLSAHTGLAPTISFMHWYNSESNSYDWGSVEATKDGGATWDVLWQKFGTLVDPWTPKSLQLDPTYAVSNFQFRFHFHSDSSVNSYAGWYIDDVAVSVATPVVIAAPCIVIPGGVVAGYVYDENSGDPLVGADVVSPTVATQTFELAGDPDNAGLYWVFQPTTTDPEDVVFTASKDLFGDDTATVSVAQDEINQQDFALGTGHLSFNPTSFEVTMQMGDPATNHTLTISNGGTAEATFELAEKDQGYLPPLSIPAFTGTLPESNAPASTGPAPEAASAPALSSNANLFDGILSGEPAFAVDLLTDNLVYFADTTIPGTWNVVGATMTSLFAGDFISGDFSTLYAISYDNNNLYTVDTATGAYTLVGAATPPAGNWTGLTGTPDGNLYGLTSVCNSSTNLVTVDPATGAVTNLGSLAGITCGIDLAYNTDEDMIYIVDIVSNELYRVDPVTLAITDVGALGVDANYAQGMDYEEETGILYWAAYTGSGELRIIDMTTGASTLVGAFPSGSEVDSLAFTTGGAADVTWLSEDPVSGTVPAAGSTDVTLTIDPVSLGQPGDYLAALKVKHNTPYTYPNIPVTLHLTAPENFGTFNGTVSGLEACDINPAPLEGATVNFWQGGVIVATTTTLADGYYSRAVPEGTYDIEVIADGYVSQTVYAYPVVGGETVTVDFDLRLLAPCLSVDPTSLEQTLAADTTASQALTLNNAGAAAVDFELLEMTPAGIMADVELILDDGTTENGIGIGGSWEFLWLNRFTPAPDAFPFTLDEVQVYFDSTGMVSVGDDIILVVYENTSGNADPAVGANWLYSYPTTIQALNAWNNYTLPEGVALDGPGDVLIGVIGLETPGTSYWPAAIDTTTTQGRSWAGWYLASPPPTPPVLPPDDTWGLIDSFGFPGNWLIRGMGSSAAADIVWLGEDPISGTVPADGSLDVTVTFDSTGQTLGDYFATLRVKNPPSPAIDVPVTMHVLDLLKIYLPLIMK